MASPPQLTVLRALGLGDLLTAVPALRALRRAFPEHRRILAAPRWLEPLLPLLVEEGRPCLDGLVAVDGIEGEPAALGPAPAVAVDLHGRGPQSHRLLLAREPGRLIAFGHPEIPESAGMPAWNDDEHEVVRWCRLLDESGIRADPEELAIRRPSTGVPPFAHGATLIHPGAASHARRWPAGYWVEVARAERAAGREVIVTGSAAEAELAATVAAGAGLDPSRVLAGAFDVGGLAALVAAAELVVCGDTGVGHLATALGSRSVLLFGPTAPRHWGPPSGSGRHFALWTGRVGDPHGTEVDPGLLAIEPEEVLAAMRATAPLGAVAR